MSKRTRYSADFKAKVALEALREELTLSELTLCRILCVWCELTNREAISIQDGKLRYGLMPNAQNSA